MNKLIITNGQSGVDAIVSVLRDGSEVIAWNDVLHDGPVPFRSTLAEQSRDRVQFLSGLPWEAPGEIDSVQSKFAERDELIGRHREFDEVVLWFDHDMYDQLQLLQIGWYFHSVAEVDDLPIVSYVLYHDYLDADDAIGMSEAFHGRVRLEASHLQHLGDIWMAFTASRPDGLAPFVASAHSPFGYLAPGILRLCQEFPSLSLALTRNEFQILSILSSRGASDLLSLFRESRSLEQIPYLGDWSFWSYVGRLAGAPVPLVQSLDEGPIVFPVSNADEGAVPSLIQITSSGTAVLDQSLNWVRPESWIGGVRLSPANDWRWDDENRLFVRLRSPS